MEKMLEMRGVSKHFASVIANSNVDFILQKGETHVLMGENGAGKTTLMNILYGLYQPDSGGIYIDGQLVQITCPSDSIALGIGMVHQHFMLVDNMTVAENVVLGNEPRKGRKLDRAKAAEAVEDISRKYNFSLEPNTLIQDLSVGKQQKVEILKLLYRGADILILDEPTAVLTPTEINELKGIIRSLNKEGKSVILITHKMREVMSMSDRVTVLRRGEVTGGVLTAETTVEQLVSMMVGKQLDLDVSVPEQQPGELVLQVQDLAVKDSRNHLAVNHLSFDVHRGEIVGIAGVDGNGQSEFLEALTGLRPIDSGSITLLGKDVTGLPTRKILNSGISSVSEDRHKSGVILGMPLYENTLLGNFYRKPYSKGVWIDYAATRRETEDMVQKFDVRTASIDSNMMWLSGGNQQKYVMAREITRPHHLLVAAQPTRGVDIGAKRFIHDQLVKERSEEKAVLLVSTELDEIMALSDRIVVMYKGSVAGIVDRANANEQILGNMMIGKEAK